MTTVEFDYTTLELCRVGEERGDPDWVCPECSCKTSGHWSTPMLGEVGLLHNGELICPTCIKSRAPGWLADLVDGLNLLDTARFYAPEAVKYGLLVQMHLVISNWMEWLAIETFAEDSQS